MIDLRQLWADQCAAALTIRERFGLPKSLGYLIGEKLLAHVRAADREPHLAPLIPDFAARVRTLFTESELRNYFDTLSRVDAAGHVLDDATHAFARAAGMFGEDDVVSAAEDVLRMERIRELVLGARPS